MAAETAIRRKALIPLAVAIKASNQYGLLPNHLKRKRVLEALWPRMRVP